MSNAVITGRRYRANPLLRSALSLRVFGEDITTAAREAAQKRRDEQVKAHAASGESPLAETDAVHEGSEGQEGEAMRTGE